MKGNNMTNEKTMTVYTDFVITPCAAGFGEYQCGEIMVSPQNSFALIQDLERAGDLLTLDEALKDGEFIAVGVKDIRGLIHNQPALIYARIFEDAFGKRVEYVGVQANEVPVSFFD